MANLSRLEDRADLQLSIVLLASWAAITISSNWGHWPPDLSALFMAGHFWAQGKFDLIYAAPDGFFGPGIAAWAKELAKLGHGGESFFPFVYPPIWAALTAQMTQSLGPTGFFNTFYIIHSTLIALSIVLTYRIIRPPVPLVLWSVISCALLFISLIASSALFHNQLQITVTFLIILALERYRSGASIHAGIALGLAAALKITPAAIGLIFLLDRDLKAATATALTGLALLALSLIIAGPDLHLEFLSSLQVISNQIAIMHVNWNMEAYLLQWAHLIFGPPLHTFDLIPNMAVPEPMWIKIANAAICLTGLAIVLMRTRDLSREDSLRIRPFGIILVLTLCAPLGWSHHYLPVMLLLPALLTFTQPLRAIALIAVFACLTSLTVFTVIKPLGTQIHVQAMLPITVMLATFAFFFARPVRFLDKPPARN